MAEPLPLQSSVRDVPEASLSILKEPEEFSISVGRFDLTSESGEGDVEDIRTHQISTQSYNAVISSINLDLTQLIQTSGGGHWHGIINIFKENFLIFTFSTSMDVVQGDDTKQINESFELLHPFTVSKGSNIRFETKIFDKSPNNLVGADFRNTYTLKGVRQT